MACQALGAEGWQGGRGGELAGLGGRRPAVLILVQPESQVSYEILVSDCQK